MRVAEAPSIEDARHPSVRLVFLPSLLHTAVAMCQTGSEEDGACDLQVHTLCYSQPITQNRQTREPF